MSWYVVTSDLKSLRVAFGEGRKKNGLLRKLNDVGMEKN
jgi:hypothetical protein